MNSLEQLLVVQDHDSHIDRLTHQRATLPERAEQQAAESELKLTTAAVAAAEDRQAILARNQRRLEDEVASTETKAKQVDRTLYGGTVSNRRELEALQAELGSLKRRQRALEDEELEVMEQLEPVEAELARLREEAAAQRTSLEQVGRRLTAAEAEIDAELDQVRAARSAAGDGIEAELRAEYESIRRRAGGIGVARLNGSTCDGCNLSLSAAEVARIRKRPANDVVHCDECGRLLVR